MLALSGWLTSHVSGINPYSHDASHLLEDLFGWGGNPHFGPFHLLSSALIIAGFFLLSSAWRILYSAQRKLHGIEEKEAYSEFAEEYSKYAAMTPAFFPKLW